MNTRRNMVAAFCLVGALGFAPWAAAAGIEFVSPADLKRLDLQQYWSLRLPLEGGEGVTRIVLVDDTIYALTSHNRALSVHANTGVIRWSNFVADEGLTVRGPTHASKYVFFTTPGSVRVFERQSGELAGAPRVLRGSVIEVASETATISIGEEHGVQISDVLNIFRSGDVGTGDAAAIARLTISSVQRRSSRGHMERVGSNEKAKPGDKVEASVMLPLREVKLPFAASSAAVSDNQSVFVGAANQRFYAIDLLNGTQRWQLYTPDTVSATPILVRDNLYIAGQDGMITSCTKDEKAKNWTFHTEAPVFADMAMDATHLYVASTDQSLYCLDRHSGRRIWRERFDTPLAASPVVSGGLCFQQVPELGLIVLHSDTGDRAWNRPQGGQLLGHLGDDTYLLGIDASHQILRVNSKNGRVKEAAPVHRAEFAVAGLADQTMFLANEAGELACLRPASAPRLSPAQVEDALRNDRLIQIAAERDAKDAKDKAAAKKKPAEPPKKSMFDDDDGLASRSTAKPVGGHGALGEKGKPATTESGEKGAKPAGDESSGAKEGEAGVEEAKDAKKPAGKKAGGEGEGEEPKEGEEAKEGEAKEGDGAKDAGKDEGEEKKADEGSDDSGDKEGDTDKKADKKKDDKKSKDEGEEGGDKEGGDKEGGGG